MAGDLTGRETFEQLVVARFKGNCEADGAVATLLTFPSLGLTHMIGGEPSPFAEVDCAQIRAMLARHLAAETTIEYSRLLGRAMARVLAHEVYHVVLETTEHGTRGVAKAALTCNDLFGGALRFEQDEIERIGEALTPEPPHGNSTVTLSILPVKAKGTL
jgi:hypothetical protein